MNSARFSDRLSAAAGGVGVAGIASALVALWMLGGTGCGKGSSDRGRAEAVARTTAASEAAATAPVPPAPPAPPLPPAPAPPALTARKLALPPEASLPGALLLGEGATLARLELAGGTLVELPSAGAGVRLFPTEAVRGSTLLAIAVLDRETEGHGAEHAEQLALVELTGSTPPRLVGPIGQVVRSPAFSADGKSVFFEASHRSFRDLYRLTLPAPTAQGAAALGETTRLSDNREGNFAPAISADGRSLAFASSRDGDSELYAMDLGASARAAKSALPPVRRLTAFHRDDWNPVWSPLAASGELVFLSDREGVERLFTMRGDGTGLRRATAEADGKASELSPAWSRDGQLAYLRSLGGRATLILGAPGTASWRTLTPSGVTTGPSFAWSPDGRWLAALELPMGKAGDHGNHGGAHAHGRLVVYAADGTARFEVMDLGGGATVRWIP